MLWEDNILFTLRHREIGNWKSPVCAQHKVLRKFMGSDDMQLKTICNFYPNECPVYYNNRRLYYEDWLQENELGSSSLIKALKIPKGSLIDNIRAIMFPLNLNSCICNSKDCLCFKRYCICVNSDQWLFRFDCDTGLLTDEIFVGSTNSRYTYDVCKWTGLEDLYVLKASYCYYDNKRSANKCMMAVFNSKLWFKHVFEVEERVFGTNYLDAEINDQLFFVYVHTNVQIYSFADLLKEGVFVLEDDSFGPDLSQRREPLKINFKIPKAPPVLLDVHCFGNKMEFGIDPHHCLIRKTEKTVFIKNFKQNTEGCFNIDELNYNETVSYKVIFHPIIPNMVIVLKKRGVHCYKIIDLPDCVQLEEALVLKFPDSYPSSPCVATEESTIFAFTFEVSLGLIGILGYHRKDPARRGFVKLFDWSSGEEVGSVKITSFYLRESHECRYTLLVDLDIVVVGEESNTDDGIKYHLIAVHGLSRREHDEYGFPTDAFY